jgi:uncharacterized membrane protein YeaQ/YmgE (transglycosylase-associated protein family)
VFIVSLILTGLVLGALARLLVPGRDPMSLPMTLLLGIVGAIVGGLIGRAIFDRNDPSFLLALVTTIGLLLVLRKTGKGRRSTI